LPSGKTLPPARIVAAVAAVAAVPLSEILILF
jgi:hypothetical protein